MNLLSHAFMARARDEDLYLFGTSLPDLLPMYDRSLRVESLIKFLIQIDANYRPLQDGIQHHLAIDRRFHSSTFFNNGQKKIRIGLQTITDIPVKRFFLAHILFEMLLDRFLLKHYPTFIDRYYQ